MESDQYMPEYWPANRIIGKLEKALVKAENILGLIQSAQIANLAAAKVTGLLTSAQIAEIEAAKIGGKLTNAQIESIEAAKITGQIVETQIGPESISTGKIKAANITTALLAAGLITAEKLAVGSVIAEKLAVNSVTAAKIAVGAVIAEKISVATLSALSANLGTVTAGTIEGVTLKGIEILIPESEGVVTPGGSINRLSFIDTENKLHSSIWSGKNASNTIIGILANYQNRRKNGIAQIGSQGSAETTQANLKAEANESASARILASAGTFEAASSVTLIEHNGASSFLQLKETSKREIMGGRVSAAGAKVSGDAGFTCKKNAAGDYTVEFTKEFTITPSVWAQPITGAIIPNYTLSEVTKAKFRFKIWNGGVAADAEFNFTVYG